MCTILWFKRDLRIEDNPALAVAAASGQGVLPLYIVEPELWAQPDRSARQWRFVAECLDGLRGDLTRLGAPLLVRVGDAVTVLERLRAHHGGTRLVSHEDTGCQWTAARDRRVADWARARGVDWQECPQPGITRGLGHRRGWQARRDRAMRGVLVPAPVRLPPHGLDPGAIPDAAELGLAFDPCPGRQKGGRALGLARLTRFLEAQATGDPAAGDQGGKSPATATQAVSRLSPYLTQGVLSAREVVQTMDARRPQDGAKPPRKGFSSPLAWGDHCRQMLASQPGLDAFCLHPAYEAAGPDDPERGRLSAWMSGETGLPFVDAAMRRLTHTGWISFPMRALLISVASHHLWLDWRVTGQHLARLFTDYDPGIHWPQVQMQSGTTGMTPPRVLDPVRAGRDLDPDGGMIRRWLPELRPVPDACLHSPWDWAGAGRFLSRAYPVPVVDPEKAARAARRRLWAVRQAEGFGETRNALLARHAAPRAERPGPTRPRSRQLSFSL